MLSKKHGVFCLLNCKRIRRFRIPIATFPWLGHLLCSMIQLFKCKSNSSKTWGASRATPWFKFPIATITWHNPRNFFFYNPTHCMTNMNKHIVNEHGVTLNGYKEQKKNNNEKSGCQQKGKKRKTMPPHFITKLFLTKTLTNQMI